MYHSQTIAGGHYAEMRLSDYLLGALIIYLDFIIILLVILLMATVISKERVLWVKNSAESSDYSSDYPDMGFRGFYGPGYIPQPFPSQNIGVASRMPSQPNLQYPTMDDGNGQLAVKRYLI